MAGVQVKSLCEASTSTLAPPQATAGLPCQCAITLEVTIGSPKATAIRVLVGTPLAPPGGPKPWASGATGATVVKEKVVSPPSALPARSCPATSTWYDCAAWMRGWSERLPLSRPRPG